VLLNKEADKTISHSALVMFVYTSPVCDSYVNELCLVLMKILYWHLQQLANRLPEN